MQTKANKAARAKQTEAKRAPLPAAAPSVAAAKPAKPSAEAKAQAAAAKQAERTAALDTVRAARKLAAEAVATYYAGSSLPFKAAADRFADLRLDKQPKRPSERQSALLASMLLAGDNIQPNGTFKRGGFTLDGKAVQPETGCLSDMLGRVVHYVSGPTSGKQQAETVLRLDFAAARSEITAHIGGALGKAALARLDALAPKAA